MVCVRFSMDFYYFWGFSMDFYGFPGCSDPESSESESSFAPPLPVSATCRGPV